MWIVNCYCMLIVYSCRYSTVDLSITGLSDTDWLWHYWLKRVSVLGKKNCSMLCPECEGSVVSFLPTLWRCTSLRMEVRLACLFLQYVYWSLFLFFLVTDPQQTVMNAQRRLDDYSGKLEQQLLRQIEVPELVQEVHPMLSLSDDCVDISLPLLSVLSSKLLPSHQKASWSTFHLYTDLSLSQMMQMTVVSPASVHVNNSRNGE